MSDRRTRFVLYGIALALAGIAVVLDLPAEREAQVESARGQGGVSRTEFAALVDSLSEPEGYFDTDNLISNETSYLHVVDRLMNMPSGRVYFGVGPEQNFSYIVHSRPSIAIIADIRRQNMLQHLLFKVLIEESADRYEFLCRLFARECGPIDPGTGLQALLDRVRTAPPDPERLAADVARVREVLTDDYGFRFGALDLERLEYVHRAFADTGLGLRFSSFGRSGAGYPTFAEMTLETDLDGEYQSYLATDELFGKLQQFQRENRLIPIVGNFAGDAALPAVAAFLEERDLEISVLYASNVEFYLFGGPGWDAWVSNLRRFPFSADAVFIRSYFPTYGVRHPSNVRPHRSTTLIQPVSGFLADFAAGRVQTYWDVVARNLD